MIHIEKEHVPIYFEGGAYLIIGLFGLKQGLNKVCALFSPKPAKNKKIEVIKAIFWNAIAGLGFFLAYDRFKQIQIDSVTPFPINQEDLNAIIHKKEQLTSLLQKTTMNIEELVYWQKTLSCDDFFSNQAALSISERCSSTSDQKIKEFCYENRDFLKNVIQRRSIRITDINNLIIETHNNFNETLKLCEDHRNKIQEVIQKMPFIRGISINWEAACRTPLWLFKLQECNSYNVIVQQCILIKKIEQNLPLFSEDKEFAKSCLETYKVKLPGIKENSDSNPEHNNLIIR